jgi:signal transduction histidine kinase/ActR/RegA family two-component response regulator
MTSNSVPAGMSQGQGDSRTRQILAAQVALLYRNASVAVVVTLVATFILAHLQWDLIAHPVILGWCLYMVVIAAGRYVLARRYLGSPARGDTGRWQAAFAVGAGLAGAGWGAAGIWLYPQAQLANQVFLVFILGGMILGAASILAARPEAYLAFIVPTGFAPAARLVLQGDDPHVAMGLLAGLFTLATLVTTRRIHQTIFASLNLQFENADLVESLQAATRHAEALNERLEVRVQERTAELERSSEQLRAEIKQREQVEEELLRARKLESLGVLAGGIAHDFNNFLAIVQGNIELARERLDRNSLVQGVLDETASACQRAAFLSSQLLTFSKGGSPVRRLVSIAKLVMEALPLVRAGSRTSFDVCIAPDLRYAELDPNQIAQVLHNILLNARQAMQESGIIEVTADNVDVETSSGTSHRVRITIRDYGCGIAAEDLPRIFDPYFTTKPGNSGLGLATSYAIVKKHGGDLSVRSKPGDGAVFTIDLPASLKTPAPEAPVVVGIRKGTERILVMDDEEALLKLVKTVLTNLGYEVQTARDGAEAIVLFEEARAAGWHFDAALLDLTVRGGMGGIETAARLKELDASLKLIVSSGYSDAPVMSDLRAYGFDDVVPKPWTVAQMSEVLRRVLVGDRKSR